MKGIRLTFLCISAMVAFAPADAEIPRIRVACVGTSITFGAGVVRRELNCYPAQLQALLGQRYDIQNFGANGATALQRGDLPYRRQSEYRKALEFLPEIVFLELGTNDSKKQNRAFLSGFESDYLELVRSFQGLRSRPRVVLLLPPPAFTADTTGITDRVIRDEIIPRIRSVAYASGCEVINLYNYFLDSPDSFPDLIHPSSVGAGLIATRLYETVMLEIEKHFDLSVNARVAGTSASYYGFECCDFLFEGRNAKIVKPKKVAKGCPWLWRARFWGHEPQTEIALLERGFHLVYCDVAELFGNDEAIGVWNRFYEMLTQGGLSRKAAFIGFSRGGVYIYRWAASNPDRIACVYADAPVLDLKSWPGGRGRGHGNSVEWERFKNDFGLKTDEEALAFKGNPLDLADQIAGAGFPLLHVCGTADGTVPIEENTDIFEKKILAAGGRITVLRKPGVDHHPHSFANPQPIVDFILRATGQKINFAAIPAPGNEYRGWERGTEWHHLTEELDHLCATQAAVDILFFGDSIIEKIGGRGRSVKNAVGESAFAEVFHRYAWLNMGVPGDRTQNLLWRVKQGNWQKSHPRLIVLTVGVNNFSTDSGDEIAEGFHAIVEAIKQKDAAAKILVVGPLAAHQKGSPFRKAFERVHQVLRSCGDGKRVFYTDLAFTMLNLDQSLNTQLVASDGIHLAPAGYALFARMLASHIEALRLLD